MKDEPEEKEADMLGRRWCAALGRFRLWRGRGLVHNRAVGEGRDWIRRLVSGGALDIHVALDVKK